MRYFGKLLCSALVAFVFTGNAIAAISTNAEGYYELASCADWNEFANKVNGGATTAKAKLVASFDCSSVTLVPAGNSSKKYEGTFDGNGFSIKNVNFGGSKYSGSYQYVGLFGYVTKGAEIKDVFVEGGTIYSKSTSSDDSGAGYAGGIAGKNEGGSIHDCVVKNVEIWGAKGGEGKRSYSGGIVGYNSGTIYNCSATGGTIIETTEAVGGIAGYNNNSGTIYDCLSSAHVESEATQSGGKAGGIIGTNEGSVYRSVYTGDYVQPGKNSDAMGGAIVGKGTACSETCFYTYEGLLVGSDDEYNGDLDDIKNKLGNPWDTMEDLDGETLILNPRDPVTGEAQSEMYYDVTFNLNGHGTLFTQTAGKDHLVAEPDAIVVQDNGAYYRTTGWKRDNTVTWNFASDKVLEKGIILYAQWSVVYRVAFDANGGSYASGTVSEKYFAQGENINANGVTQPGRVGYAFLGWATTGTATVAESNLGTMGTNGLTFYAVWEVRPDLTITYSSEGSKCNTSDCSGITGGPSPASAVKKYGQDFTLSSTLYTGAYTGKSTFKTNYEQIGWTTTKSGTTVEYPLGGVYTGNESKIFYPVWKKQGSTTTTTYAVTYNPGSYGSGTVSSQEKIKDVALTLSKETFTREGYVQDGWSTSQNGNRMYALGGNYVKNEKITLYPHWVKKVTVTFMDGENEYSTVAVDKGSHIPKPSNPSKTGYEFRGWYNENNFQTEFVFVGSSSKDPIAEDIIVYAKFEAKTYEVTILLDGVSADAPAKAEYVAGATVTLTVPQLPDELASSYGFYQWGESYDDVTIANNSFEMPAHDVDITAYFKQAYTVTYKPGVNGTGSEMSVQKLDGVSLTLEDALFTRDGYKQVGWTKTENGAKLYDLTAAYTDAAAAILYPVWELETYSIVYMDGESPIQESLLAEGSATTFSINSDAITLKDAKTKVENNGADGYVFEGWYSDSELKNKVTTISAGSHADVTLYAKYTKASNKIVYFLDGTQEMEWVLPNADINVRTPSEEGYTFSGWTWWYYEDNEQQFLSSAPTKMPNYDLMAEGYLTTRVTVTFDANGGSFAEDAVTSKFVTKSMAITAEGITQPSNGSQELLGWSLNQEDTAPSSLGVAGDDAVTVFAVWGILGESVEINIGDRVVEIWYDTDDTQDSISKKVNEAVAKLDPPMEKPTKTDPDGKITYEFDKFVCDDDFKCEPSFSETPKEYAITYNLPGGSSSSSSYTYSETDDFTLSTDIVVTDWTFSAWYSNAEHSGDAVTKIAKGTIGDKAFYALYTQDISVTIGDKTFPVTIDSDDDADDVNAKILAEARKQGIEDPTKTDPDGKIVYEFEKYNCTAGASGYTCENIFNGINTAYTISVVLPEGATLVCTEGAQGAANCNEAGTGIVHQYGEETTPLPNAAMDGWTFEGWFDNADGIDDGTNGNEVTSISKDVYGDDIEVYPYFTKTIEVTIGGKTFDVVIDYNDTQDSINAKVTALAESEGLTPDPKHYEDAPNIYDYAGFTCELKNESYVCEAKFDATGMTYEVVENLPEGATLVCTGDPLPTGAANCNEDGTGIVHQYGKETTPLPDAAMDGWTFEGWFDNADGIDDGTNGNEVTSISKDVYGDDIEVYPYFTKKLVITLSEEVKVTVTLDNNDDADSVSAKVNEVYAALEPKPADPTKESSDKYDYTFKNYECSGTDVEYTCVAKFDSTGRVFEVAFNLPEGATLVSPLDSYTYGNGVTLPEAQLEGWTFDRWVDGTGNTVSAIGNEEFGDKSFTPVFKKNIEVVIGDVTLEVEILYTDTDEQIQEKIAAAMAAHDPKIDTPTKDESDTHTFAFDKFVVNEDGKYVPAFDSTGRVFEVVENLPEGATLVCTEGAKGAANCNEDGTGIVHQYGKETTPLPDVVIVDGEGEVDETWEFQGWFDNADGIDDGTNGKEVTSISKDEYGDNINIYPYFTKQIEITLSGDPEVKVEITIDNNDNADSVSQKVNDAVAALDPKPSDPTRPMDDSLVYTFREYECTGSGVDFTCEAKFDSTGRVFEVVENLPEGATLVCTEGAQGAKNCNSDKTGIKHQYGVETTPLPNAAMEGWTFEGWYGDGTIFAEPAVTSIPADEYGEEINIFPKFTKQIEITLSEDPEVKVTITLDNNDNADSVSQKVNEAYENLTPAPADPTRPMDDSLVYTFKEYECKGTGVDYTCEAKFDSTGRVFEVVENLSDNMKLVCEGEAAAACNEFETGIEHKYGVETNPLPEVVIVDSEGKVDEFWEFQGWFDNADGIDDGKNGNKVEKIDAEVFGDVVIYPYFTKVIEVVIGDQTIKIVIDDNDTQDSINAKVSEAAKNHDPVIEPDPKHIEKEPFIYDFAGYKCELLESNRYECVPDFDESGKKYEVAVNLPKDAKLLCEGEAAAACNEAGDAIVHQYGTETSPLPSAVIIGMDGSVDESWHFRGWFDNENGIADGSMEGGAGKKIFEIAAERYGDIDIYPYFTKTIQVKIGNEVVDVVIDNNDTQDSISVKATEAAANREPPIPTPTKDKDDKYEYEFAGYVCDQKFVCEPTFDAVPYDVEVVLAYGDDAEDTIMVKVLSTDDVPTIEKKVYVEFMSHDPMLPIPEKASDPMYTYEFNKFAVNLETGRYEPKFTSSPRIYKITFNMPEDAKLTKEISGNTYGEETILPQAVINGSDWQFKGWYTEKDGNGSRVKVIGAQDVGAREYFALFQKTVVYEVNGKQGNLEVAYSANASKAVDLALSGVIVKDFEENGKTYTFSKWELKKGVYVAKFTDITAIAQTNVPHFSVIAVDRTLEITGAKMGAKIAVFDLGGRLVTTGIVANGTQLVELANPGSYIVRVNNQVRRVNVR